MKTQKYFTIFILLIISVLSCREDYVDPELFGHLNGEVLNAEDYTPMVNVSVKLSPSAGSVLTDSLGNFRFDSLKVGSYTLEIKKSEYDTELLTVEIFDLQTTEVNVLLGPDLIPNSAPERPFNPLPEDFSSQQEINTTLMWEAFDANEEDSLSYTIYFFAEGEVVDEPYVENWKDNYLEINNLDYGSVYFWQVVVMDGEAEPVYGPIWRFKTIEFPDYRLRWVRKVDGKYQIFSSDEEGNELQITFGTASCWRPKISPDRSQVAFISNQDIDAHIYIMDMDGSNSYKVTSIPIASVNTLELDFTWSPDGSKLLYMNNDRLFSIQKDGSGLSQIATAPPGKFFTSVDLTDQGNDLVVRISGADVYNSEIYLIDENGGMTQVVENQSGKTGNPVFSIDGTKILYTHDVSGFQNLEGRQLDSHIFMLDLLSGDATDLSIHKEAGTNDLDPQFSPNGSEVVFTNTDNDGISVKQIYRMDLDAEIRHLIVADGEMVDWK